MNRRKKQKKAQQQLDLKLKGKEKVKEIMIFDLKLIHTRQRYSRQEAGTNTQMFIEHLLN